MNMDFTGLDLQKLSPEWLRKDPTITALNQALTPDFRAAFEAAEILVDWNNIDKYPVAVLDALAWELSIDWYDFQAKIEVKQRLIRSSDAVHMKLGTPWAAERVIQDYFGAGFIEEWFEYGGEPYYFRIWVDTQLDSPEDYRRFMALLEKVKRKSAWLDKIILLKHMRSDLRLHTKANAYEVPYWLCGTFACGRKPYPMWQGIGHHVKLDVSIPAYAIPQRQPKTGTFLANQILNKGDKP